LAGKASLKQHGFGVFSLLIGVGVIAGVLLNEKSLTEDDFEAAVYSITRIRGSTIVTVPLAFYGCAIQGLLIVIFHQYAKLTSGEEEFCSAILHQAKHLRYRSKAAKLIQLRWRMREHNPEHRVFASFASLLQNLEWAGDCSHPSYFTLEKQIFLLEKGIQAKIQATKEGIKEAEMGVLEQLHALIRANYRILVVCSSLRKSSLNPKTQSRVCSQTRRSQLTVISEEDSEIESSP
jgi:hypothetical protein